jgi:hypothetical protein
MRRVITFLAMGLFLLGCGSAPTPHGFPLLTGELGCYAGGETGSAGTLEFDPQYGTRFNGRPVMWAAGFTGVRVGDEVQVRDAEGIAVATTGRKYYISVAYAEPSQRELIDKTGSFPAAAHCGYPWDFVECSTPATGQPGLATAKAACASNP